MEYVPGELYSPAIIFAINSCISSLETFLEWSTVFQKKSFSIHISFIFHSSIYLADLTAVFMRFVDERSAEIY